MYPNGEMVGFDRELGQDCAQFKFLSELAGRGILEDDIQERFVAELAENAGRLIYHEDAFISRELLERILNSDSLPNKVRDYPTYKSLVLQSKKQGIID